MSAADLRARVASQLEALSAPGAPLHINAAGATWRLHAVGTTDPYAGRYAPSRVRLHAALVEEFRTRHPDVATEGLAAVATAGPPAVGKSTRLKELGYAEASWRRIDPDDFKTMLIEQDLRDGSLAIPTDVESKVLHDGRGILPLELSGIYHHESTVIADKAREISLAARSGNLSRAGGRNGSKEDSADASPADASPRPPPSATCTSLTRPPSARPTLKTLWSRQGRLALTRS